MNEQANAERERALEDSAKAKVRKKAKARFRITVVILVLCSGVAAWALWGLQFIPKLERQAELSSQSTRLYYEYMRFYVEHGIALGNYIPPANPADRAGWAKDIETELNHSAALFIKDKSGLTWIKDPPPDFAQKNVEQAITALDTASKFPKPLKEFGSTGVWSRGFESGDTAWVMWLAAQHGNGLRWGAVFPTEDDWLAFFSDLKTPRGVPLNYGGPAWMLNGSYALPSSQNPQLQTGMRAFLHDSLIFVSPDLHVSRDSLQWNYAGGPRMEFFTGSGDFTYAKTRFLTWVFLPFILFPLVLIIPFYRWYRMVMNLTEKG